MRGREKTQQVSGSVHEQQVENGSDNPWWETEGGGTCTGTVPYGQTMEEYAAPLRLAGDIVSKTWLLCHQRGERTSAADSARLPSQACEINQRGDYTVSTPFHPLMPPRASYSVRLLLNGRRSFMPLGCSASEADLSHQEYPGLDLGAKIKTSSSNDSIRTIQPTPSCSCAFFYNCFTRPFNA
ncbi:expressed unknown protein [Seminavis robusta]|uniref:Uncharacterized protein n=1 Tax=Seminavis robusta TaxID=568900 RepID=A0A9N8F477_9STRA|nr:expressed unknown protein [Seminavis robusta]|eukprot:Sro2889_g339491.1  (183) ;mRNA; r:1239-1787